ncbi:TBC domain protein [Gregarina niphandrodes]|uniref:TBC domain protein n=1 Tax=Gregarina niphandrodes TaxID=110365 RepID=A0A023B0F9_GRENI|nr:TBC domain protein [Gregarina niphandrodes]EZG44184.1 TBC domain protein [Gregarina niphandrodes]|eukprot:XP_011132770.1 TBC domain protein [Gregarina niphandrodes]
MFLDQAEDGELSSNEILDLRKVRSSLLEEEEEELPLGADETFPPAPIRSFTATCMGGESSPPAAQSATPEPLIPGSKRAAPNRVELPVVPLTLMSLPVDVVTKGVCPFLDLRDLWHLASMNCAAGVLLRHVPEALSVADYDRINGVSAGAVNVKGTEIWGVQQRSTATGCAVDLGHTLCVKQAVRGGVAPRLRHRLYYHLIRLSNEDPDFIDAVAQEVARRSNGDNTVFKSPYRAFVHTHSERCQFIDHVAPLIQDQLELLENQLQEEGADAEGHEGRSEGAQPEELRTTANPKRSPGPGIEVRDDTKEEGGDDDVCSSQQVTSGQVTSGQVTSGQVTSRQLVGRLLSGRAGVRSGDDESENGTDSVSDSEAAPLRTEGESSSACFVSPEEVSQCTPILYRIHSDRTDEVTDLERYQSPFSTSTGVPVGAGNVPRFPQPSGGTGYRLGYGLRTGCCTPNKSPVNDRRCGGDDRRCGGDERSSGHQGCGHETGSGGNGSGGNGSGGNGSGGNGSGGNGSGGNGSGGGRGLSLLENVALLRRASVLTREVAPHHGSEEAGRLYSFLVSEATVSANLADLIDRDLDRTFPSHPLFRCSLGEHMKSAMRDILLAVAVVEPGLGYCQGFNFMAATLLIELVCPVTAFWTLIFLLRRRGLAGLFNPSLSAMSLKLMQLREMLRLYIPETYISLRRAGVQSDLLCHQSLITSLTYFLHPSVVIQFWDGVVLGGFRVFLVATLAIIFLLDRDLHSTFAHPELDGHRPDDEALQFVQSKRLKLCLLHRESAAGREFLAQLVHAFLEFYPKCTSQLLSRLAAISLVTTVKDVVQELNLSIHSPDKSYLRNPPSHPTREHLMKDNSAHHLAKDTQHPTSPRTAAAKHYHREPETENRLLDDCNAAARTHRVRADPIQTDVASGDAGVVVPSTSRPGTGEFLPVIQPPYLLVPRLPRFKQDDREETVQRGMLVHFMSSVENAEGFRFTYKPLTPVELEAERRAETEQRQLASGGTASNATGYGQVAGSNPGGARLLSPRPRRGHPAKLTWSLLIPEHSSINPNEIKLVSGGGRLRASSFYMIMEARYYLDDERVPLVASWDKAYLCASERADALTAYLLRRRRPRRETQRLGAVCWSDLGLYLDAIELNSTRHTAEQDSLRAARLGVGPGGGLPLAGSGDLDSGFPVGFPKSQDENSARTKVNVECSGVDGGEVQSQERELESRSFSALPRFHSHLGSESSAEPGGRLHLGVGITTKSMMTRHRLRQTSLPSGPRGGPEVGSGMGAPQVGPGGGGIGSDFGSGELNVTVDDNLVLLKEEAKRLLEWLKQHDCTFSTTTEQGYVIIPLRVVMTLVQAFREQNRQLARDRAHFENKVRVLDRQVNTLIRQIDRLRQRHAQQLRIVAQLEHDLYDQLNADKFLKTPKVKTPWKRLLAGLKNNRPHTSAAHTSTIHTSAVDDVPDTKSEGSVERMQTDFSPAISVCKTDFGEIKTKTHTSIGRTYERQKGKLDEQTTKLAACEEALSEHIAVKSALSQTYHDMEVVQQLEELDVVELLLRKCCAWQRGPLPLTLLMQSGVVTQDSSILSDCPEAYSTLVSLPPIIPQLQCIFK